ncbi:MAG TPA: response regulator transcription factor [Chroococcales cyanobacterium]
MADILVIDDDLAFSLTMVHMLEYEQHTVDCAHTGAEGSDLLSRKQYDLIILDLGLPDIDGTELCQSFRRKGIVTPIIMLTGRGDVEDRITGLDLGGDDYLPKPFHRAELMARVRALLRRPKELLNTMLKVGEIELDSLDRKAYKHGVLLKLSPSEFALLEFFMRNVDRVFSSESLISHVWKADRPIGSETVRTVVKCIRQEIDDPDGISMIQNIHGIGYKMVQPDTISQKKKG